MLTRCLGCAYRLAGLPESGASHRCPECGRWNTAWCGARPDPDHRLDLACVVAPTLVLGIAGAVLMALGFAIGGQFWMAMVLASWTVPVAVAALVEVRDRDRGLPSVFGGLAVLGLWGNVAAAAGVVLAARLAGLG